MFYFSHNFLSHYQIDFIVMYFSFLYTKNDIINILIIKFYIS